MSGLIRFLGSVTGAQYGNIAFWLPAVFAGFCAIAAFAWGMLVAGPWVGLVGAVYATSIPAYYFRTRLSYYDTDVVTLFFPLLISVLLARWVSLGIRDSWLPKKTKEVEFKPTVWGYCLPVVAGALTSYGSLWHANVLTFGQLSIFVAFGLTLFCGTQKSRPDLLRGLILFLVSSLAGLFGVAAALLLILIFTLPSVKDHKLYRNLYVLLAFFVAIAALNGMGQTLVSTILIKISSYLKPVSDVASTVSGPQYPGITQSVIEAQNVSFDILFSNLTGSEVLGWFGFATFFFALFMRPLLVFLLPFVAVTFASVYMGGRFSMFGGIVLGIGLSFVIYWLINQFIINKKQKMFLGLVQSVVIIAILFSNLYTMYIQAPPTPIMGPAHVKALIESGKNMPKDSTVWTWWDWGYATMYYAGVNSFANGGNHYGTVLFPLSFAYATPSFLQSNQVIKFSAVNGNNPAAVWGKMSGKEVQELVQSFGSVRYEFPNTAKQYIVVSWENIRLAYWILYYGSWNVRTAIGVHPNVLAINSAFDFNYEEGLFTTKGDSPLKVSSYDFLKSNQRLTRAFSRSVGPHLLFNEAISQGFLVDSFAYSSMLIRLLLDDPTSPDIANYFKITYEGYPSVRVYEVI
ncbi:STT3 domain-containing protein [Maridesulfovibrio ferrireducens]|nr:STT3 domain-containing protein [Maridesulfovibrio ferrireducens]